MESDINDLFSDPSKFVILVLITVVTVGIAFSIVSYAYSGVGTGAVEYIELFDVADPSVEKVCNLTNSPDSSTVSVEQYNGFAWADVNPTYVSTSGSEVTVQPGGMQG